MPDRLPDDVTESSSAETSTPEASTTEGIGLHEIDSVHFPLRMRGYDRDEVDAFLTLVATEMRHLLEALARAEEDNAAPYAKLGADAGRVMQLARDNADRMLSEGLAQVAAERAAALSDLDELKQRAATEAAALRELAERDAAAIREEADRVRSEAQTRAMEIVLDAETEAASIREAHQHIRAETEAGVRALRAEAEEEVKYLKEKARADYTVMEREAHREANRIEKAARESAELQKDEAEENSLERVRQARAEVRRLNETEVALKNRIQALQTTLDSLSKKVDDDDGRGAQAPPSDLTG